MNTETLLFTAAAGFLILSVIILIESIYENQEINTAKEEEGKITQALADLAARRKAKAYNSFETVEDFEPIHF